MLLLGREPSVAAHLVLKSLLQHRCYVRCVVLTQQLLSVLLIHDLYRPVTGKSENPILINMRRSNSNVRSEGVQYDSKQINKWIDTWVEATEERNGSTHKIIQKDLKLM